MVTRLTDTPLNVCTVDRSIHTQTILKPDRSVDYNAAPPASTFYVVNMFVLMHKKLLAINKPITTMFYLLLSIFYIFTGRSITYKIQNSLHLNLLMTWSQPFYVPTHCGPLRTGISLRLSKYSSMGNRALEL